MCAPDHRGGLLVLVVLKNGKLQKQIRTFGATTREPFREWFFDWTPIRAGRYKLMARATNRIGESQPSLALWNPAGYLRNVVELVDVTTG
jgi:hypothetical protein